MGRSVLTGTRIRERRLLLSLRQADLARAAGVSPSYLNLIEHNRRRIGADLLGRVATALEVDPAALSEGAQDALLDALREAAVQAGEGLAERGAQVAAQDLDRAEEFAGQFPAWAALVAAQQRRIAGLERAVGRMADRMTHDPYLSTSLHEVLSAVTALRATAAILVETEDIEPVWRQKFHRNLLQDSVRLAGGAEALVAYLDGAGAQEAGLGSPQEECEAWLETTAYHIAALEQPGAAASVETAVIAAAPDLATLAARALAAAYLTRYRRDASAVPGPALRALVAACGPDPAAVAARFGVDLPTAFRRLASLPADVPGAADIGLVICDGSGTPVFRKPVAGFALPRFGAACPLWPLYQALSRPMAPLRMVVEMAGPLPQRFMTYSVCAPVTPPGFDGPAVLHSQMLILPGPALATAAAAQPVGVSCRICPRTGCTARREPSILSDAAMPA